MEARAESTSCTMPWAMAPPRNRGYQYRTTPKQNEVEKIPGKSDVRAYWWWRSPAAHGSSESRIVNIVILNNANADATSNAKVCITTAGYEQGRLGTLMAMWSTRGKRAGSTCCLRLETRLLGNVKKINRDY
jgi:hypothetical protein